MLWFNELHRLVRHSMGQQKQQCPSFMLQINHKLSSWELKSFNSTNWHLDRGKWKIFIKIYLFASALFITSIWRDAMKKFELWLKTNMLWLEALDLLPPHLFSLVPCFHGGCPGTSVWTNTNKCNKKKTNFRAKIEFSLFSCH